jgi:glycosyltransferase involved in cell wall biosynthesis
VVSVILPNYNHDRYLKRRIDSILSQTYQDFELLILDDCSTDNSRAIIEEYRSQPKVTHIIYNEVNTGSPFKQWDAGITLAQGELIWLAESDDIAENNFLERLVPLLANAQDTGIAYCQSNRLNDKNEVTGTWLDWTANFGNNIFISDFEMEGKKFVKDFLIYINAIPNASAVIFKKSLYLQVGGVKEDSKTNNDWLLWLKILTISNIQFIAAPLNYFRYHEESVIAKANRSSGNNFYIGRYDRKLRFFFQDYLQLFSGKNNENIYKEILVKNKHLIADNYRSEAFFQFGNGQRLNGFDALLKAVSYAGINLNHVKIALARFIKSVFAARK